MPDNQGQAEVNHLSVDRRRFLSHISMGSAGAVLTAGLCDYLNAESPDKYEPVSDRRIRVGIVGYGASRWGGAFGFQDHPNVEVVAVSDLFSDRRNKLAEVCRCKKMYDSLSDLLHDSRVEAVFLATDAPSHAKHSIETIRQGKHVFVAVPATFGSIEEGEELLETVNHSGLTYMMAETTAYQADCYAMRQLYEAGGFGSLICSEGEYSHYCPGGVFPKSYKNWRRGVPPFWYPTHSIAYYTHVTGGQYKAVSAIGHKGWFKDFQPGANQYGNQFTDGVALFQTPEGGASRITMSWAQYKYDVVGGRVSGDKGWMDGIRRGEGNSWKPTRFETTLKNLPRLSRPALPEGVPPGGHGGAHGHLTHEFISALLESRQPTIDVYQALAMTIPGIVAHESALRGGELLKVPQYNRPANS